MANNRELSEFGSFVSVDNTNKTVGIATTVRITSGGLFVGAVQAIRPDGTWGGSTAGIQGAQGTGGVQGTTGTQGTTGAQGTTGTQGITGTQGATGSQGTTGAQGATGTQGVQGTSGATVGGTANQVVYKNGSNVTSGDAGFTFNDSTNVIQVGDQHRFGMGTFTTAQRDALTSIATGTVIYNTTTATGQIYDGTVWIDFGDNGTKTYVVSPSTSSVNEGSSVTFTVNTGNVPSGTTLYWTTNVISGTVNASDFSDSSLSGSFTITGPLDSGTGTIIRTLTSDKTTEGSESFQIQIRIGSTSGTVVATSTTVTINDTSQTPTYAVSPSTTSVNEGSTVTFTVTTTDVDDGTTLYWTTNVISGTVNASDFSDSATSGSFTITSGSGSVSRTLANDLTTEGSESFQIQIRTGSTSGTIVATSATVTINDTSLTPFLATGGTESTTSRSGYKVHTFTGPGSFNVTQLSKNVEVLIVGGGGSGGRSGSFQAGGGGAGALIYKSSVPVSPGSYPITIGSGGSGGGTENPGQSTTAFGYTAPGGGRGAAEHPGGNTPAGGGGSGGGGQWTTPTGGTATGASGGTNGSVSPDSGWGRPGGNGSGSGGSPNSYSGAGGGGASAAGSPSPTTSGTPGGNGLAYSINGTSTSFAGGGGGTWRGGGSWPGGAGGGGASQTSGTANTGGGGGGQGGSGGSGIVIVAYPTA